MINNVTLESSARKASHNIPEKSTKHTIKVITVIVK
jgi:hypothetical protein